MAKTSEAIKRAEKDWGVSVGIPPLTSVPEDTEKDFLPPPDHGSEEIFSIKEVL